MINCPICNERSEEKDLKTLGIRLLYMYCRKGGLHTTDNLYVPSLREFVCPNGHQVFIKTH